MRATQTIANEPDLESRVVSAAAAAWRRAVGDPDVALAMTADDRSVTVEPLDRRPGHPVQYRWRVDLEGHVHISLPSRRAVRQQRQPDAHVIDVAIHRYVRDAGAPLFAHEQPVPARSTVASRGRYVFLRDEEGHQLAAFEVSYTWRGTLLLRRRPGMVEPAAEVSDAS